MRHALVSTARCTRQIAGIMSEINSMTYRMLSSLATFEHVTNSGRKSVDSDVTLFLMQYISSRIESTCILLTSASCQSQLMSYYHSTPFSIVPPVTSPLLQGLVELSEADKVLAEKIIRLRNHAFHLWQVFDSLSDRRLSSSSSAYPKVEGAPYHKLIGETDRELHHSRYFILTFCRESFLLCTLTQNIFLTHLSLSFLLLCLSFSLSCPIGSADVPAQALSSVPMSMSMPASSSSSSSSSSSAEVPITDLSPISTPLPLPLPLPLHCPPSNNNSASVSVSADVPFKRPMDEMECQGVNPNGQKKKKSKAEIKRAMRDEDDSTFY